MNKADRLRYEKLTELGCIVSVDGVRCKSPSECHHLISRSLSKKSANHLAIPLCPHHHRNGGKGQAIHAGIKSWVENFGTEAELLALTNELIGE